MKKRYTITFNPKLASIDEPLRIIKSFGVEVQSTQRFIGTAVVEADERQVKRVQDMDAIAGVTETGSFRAMGAS